MNENLYEMIPPEDSYKVEKCPPVQKVGDSKQELKKVKDRRHLADKPDNFRQFLSKAVENLDRESQKENRIKEARK